MSVSRPARCFFSTPSIPARRPRVRCRNFHTSPNLCERRRPRIPNVKASEMGLVAPQRPAGELFKPYTKGEKQALAKKYTSAQMEVVEAGEKAVTAEDLDKRGVIRSDPGLLNYLDDFSVVQGVVDKRPEADEPIDPNLRLMTPNEYFKAHDEYMRRFKTSNDDSNPEKPALLKKTRPNRRDLLQTIAETPMFMGSNGPVRGQTVVAPAVPKYIASPNDVQMVKKKELEEEELDERDPEGKYDQLRKQTGFTLDEIWAFKVKILVIHRVVNQTRLGKVASMYILAIAGNGDGRLGLGQAKGQDLENTIDLAKIAAIRNMQPIPRYEHRTIFGEVEAKVSAVEVKLSARPPGFGLRCQHLIFEMARAAGLQDLAARVPRSRNKMNTVKATYQALMSQRIPEEIARGRGLKLVDVRKVYYGGRV